MSKEVWLAIAGIYGGIEIILFTLTYHFPVLTEWVIEKIIRLVLGRRSCLLGYHRWKYEVNDYRAEGIKHIKKVTLYERECKGICCKHQYSFQHPKSKLFNKWTTGQLKSPLKFKQL